ncbi:MAG TPA: protocatechuate 3,4-dioxygenase subunit alpha [Candidatus Acidoferrales bacterium]|nr:protocatechuate 3,4-dioxygenase subunit alpha [Candidatus Acidoferrales bacterium]
MPTPSQTVGPFFRAALHRPAWEDIAAQLGGTAIRISGRVLDGDGAPVPDAMLEIWQADESGTYADGTIRGFGRACTNERGEFALTTIVPGAQEGAPHLNVSVFARGLLKRLVTRIYFADRAEDNARDAALMLVPPERRATLLATGDGNGSYRFDVALQGGGETVFFAI